MSNLLENLNEEQKQAVTVERGPLLIVAGAGTGKTTVITRRLAWLIEQKLARPEEILAMTFTEKAAEEMEERIDRLLPYGYLDLWISTFHAFGDRLLRQHGLDIGLSDDFKILTPTEAWLLMRQNLDKFNLDYYRPLGNPAKFLHALIKHFSRCKDEKISPAEYLKYAEGAKLGADLPLDSNIRPASEESPDEIRRLTEISNAFHVYNQLLLDHGALDFGDLINYALKLFQTRPKILEKYRRQFKYILIDEFQDTNLAQYELIKILSAPKNNLAVVGDDDQSIYKFRGASVSNILHFKKDFPHAREVVLNQNFRSCQNILDLSYRLIQNNNPDRLEVKLGVNKKLTAAKTGRGTTELMRARTGEEEAKMVAEKIMEIYNRRNPSLRLDVETRNDASAASWNDFAILTRANSQAELFIQAMERADLPYQFLSSSGLYRQPIVLDILAYLRLLDNYHENTAVYRVLNFPLWKLEIEDIVRLNHFAKKKAWSLYETMKRAAALSLSPPALENIARILSLIEKHAAMAREQSAGRVILAFLTDSGYLMNLTERERHGESEAVKKIFHLKKFFDNVSKFEKNRAEKKVRHYLEELNYVLESGDEGSMAGTTENGPEAIKITTVHGAKGMEFPYVFIVNLVELKFPSIDRKEPIEIPEAMVKEIISEGDIHLQEERRLFYVAATRAKNGVFFSFADDYGGTRKRKASRFLNEIGLEKTEEAKKDLSPISDIQYPDSPKPQPATKLILPKYFSYTQLKAFETCPLQYKFAHLLKIPTKGKGSFSFGKTMHLSLQKFYQKIVDLSSFEQIGLFAPPLSDSPTAEKAPSMEDLLRIYDSSWIDDWYDDKTQKEKFYQKGREILKNFYNLHQGRWRPPRFLEAGFRLKMGESVIRGQIDRVDDLPDGTAEIIDYKTGSPKTEEKLTSEDKEQLLIYQLAAEESLGLKPSVLSFYYLDDNRKISFLGSDKELEKLKEKISKILFEIKKSDFPPRPSLYFCRHCDFKNICEWAKL